MRLGVNALRLSGQRLGVGRYIEYLLKLWQPMLTAKDEVVLYVRTPFDPKSLGLSDAFQSKLLRPELTGVLWENLLLPPHSGQIDVLFCPSYTMPLAYPGRCVVANHSVNEVQSGTHPWWYDLTYRQRYRMSARRADVVIVPSESTKTDIQKEYDIARQKIEVVPQGCADHFRPQKDEAKARSIRQRYFGDDRPFILFVGKLSQRRNIPELIRAFSAIKQEKQLPHGLLLLGPNTQNLPLEAMTRELGVSDSVVQNDGKFDDHRELVSIYNAADVFVHPSSYEGFSLTIVEALACGVPVVTVNRGAAKEIAGDAAVLVDDPTPDQLAGAFRRLFDEPGLKQALPDKGVARARHFRYEDTARRTLEICRAVAEGRGVQ